jgi:hypothetical protein
MSAADGAADYWLMIIMSDGPACCAHQLFIVARGADSTTTVIVSLSRTYDVDCTCVCHHMRSFSWFINLSGVVTHQQVIAVIL